MLHGPDRHAAGTGYDTKTREKPAIAYGIDQRLRHNAAYAREHVAAEIVDSDAR